MNISRLETTLEQINEIGASAGNGITRLGFTKEHWAANEFFIEACKREGMQVRIDACGNVIARREGKESGLPAVACGSHLDTVQQGGKYDGTVGVAAGLELIRSLNEKGIFTRHPIEVIVFACEESARFGVSTIGSKAMAGKLSKASVERLKDRAGISIEEAAAAIGVDFNRIENARRSRDELKAFFELHIEQGPLLEGSGKQVGIVTGIAAPIRLDVTIQGKASHSGTTPMNMRSDALIGAAEMIIEIERAALDEAKHGTVATVGVCDVKPGAMNVIPDWVNLKIDIRGTVTASRQAVIERLYRVIRELDRNRGLIIASDILSDEEPVVLDERIIRFLSVQCERLNITYTNMMSGAGHDAMNMASLCPTGMIFIPSYGGLSHHKDEYSSLEQIAHGTALLEETVLQCAEVIHGELTSASIHKERSHGDESGKVKSNI
jgi:hydantoinase/carbamoylase family amidase